MSCIHEPVLILHLFENPVLNFLKIKHWQSGFEATTPVFHTQHQGQAQQTPGGGKGSVRPCFSSHRKSHLLRLLWDQVMPASPTRKSLRSSPALPLSSKSMDRKTFSSCSSEAIHPSKALRYFPALLLCSSHLLVAKRITPNPPFSSTPPTHEQIVGSMKGLCKVSNIFLDWKVKKNKQKIKKIQKQKQNTLF